MYEAAVDSNVELVELLSAWVEAVTIILRSLEARHRVCQYLMWSQADLRDLLANSVVRHTSVSRSHVGAIDARLGVLQAFEDRVIQAERIWRETLMILHSRLQMCNDLEHM